MSQRRVFMRWMNDPDRWWEWLVVPAIFVGLRVLQAATRPPTEFRFNAVTIALSITWYAMFLVFPSMKAGALFGERQRQRNRPNWLIGETPPFDPPPPRQI